MKIPVKLFVPLALLGLVLAACDDSPSEPGSQPIVGTWKTSKTGLAFSGTSSKPTFTFSSDGSMKIDDLNGVDVTGSYSTSGSSASSTIREITMSMSGMTFSGIYLIDGSQMKLEVVPVPPPSGITGPSVVGGIGSTTVSGQVTSEWVTELQKQ